MTELCPIGRNGEFCKHSLALGPAWHAGGESDDASDTEGPESAFGEVEIRAYLLGMDKEQLESILLDQAAANERLHRWLMIRAAQAARGPAKLSVWKKALHDALALDGFVHDRETRDYATDVGEVVESLEDLLLAGRADSVIRLAEHGLTEVERSLDHIDDSGGWVGEILGRLQELHLEACRQARPDPVGLAERLFEWEMESSYDAFHGAATNYADILGEVGLAAYRRLAEAAWTTVPALRPGDGDPNRYGCRSRVTSIMEAMAQRFGDLDALISVKSRNLSSPSDFLAIANLYQDAGDTDTALDWAERGWRAFAGSRRDDRLRDFIADAYQGRGRGAAAMTLIWEAFVAHPHLKSYRLLERHGRRAGRWARWREKALAVVRERIADEPAASPGRPTWTRGPSLDHSLLVEILLHEGDPESAWLEAEKGGCSEGLWLELAKRREMTHPEDSVRIYRARVGSLLRNRGDHTYQEADGTLDRIGTLLARSGKEAAFRSLLAELRATHKRKGNLMKMLDSKGW